MKNRAITRIVALLLALALPLSGCQAKPDSSGEADASFNTPVVQTTEQKENVPEGLGDKDFSKISYERREGTTMQSLMDELEAALENGTDPEEVLDLFDEVREEAHKISEAYTLANIYNSLDTSDEYYMDELTYMQEVGSDTGDRMCTLAKAILGSDCGEAARKRWRSVDVEYYEKYREMTEEQKALVNEEQKLIVKYTKQSTEEYTVDVNGTPYTYSDLMTDDTMDYDEFYRYYVKLMQDENKAMGETYLELLDVRKKIAQSYGYDSYADYAYKEVYQRDYTTHDAEILCHEVKEKIAPFYQMLYDGTDSYNIDTFAEELSVEEQMEMVRSYLDHVDPEMVEYFDYMVSHNLYDLDYADRKLDGGFTTFLAESREPYMFNLRSDTYYDISTLIHEFGHYNSYCVNVDTSADYSCLDLAEIASQGLELLYLDVYPDMLGDEYALEAEQYVLCNLMRSIIDGCLYDEFQREVYAMENPTLSQINRVFGKLMYEYGYYEDDGMEGYGWVEVPHNFQSPMYYISYAVSVIPAFEIWEMSLEDYEGACEIYKKLVSVGEVGTFKDGLREAGLSLPFEKECIDSLAQTFVENVPLG